MPDDPSPIVAARTGEFGSEALSGETIESILAEFRAWLQEAHNEPATTADSIAPSFDVATVLQHFIALRQEINLQTKASRGQLEQNAQTIDMLQEALGTLQRQESEPPDNDEIVRPLLKTLIDAHDALSLAERQVR